MNVCFRTCFYVEKNQSYISFALSDFLTKPAYD